MVLPSRALAVALCVAVAFGQGFGQVRVDDENMEQPDLLDMASFLELNGEAPAASSLPQRPQQDLEQAPPARFQRQGQAQKLERGFKHKDNPKATADSRGDPWWAYMDAAAPPEWLVPPWADAPGMSDMPKMAKPRPIAPPPPPPEGMGRYYPPPPPPPPSPPPPLPPPPPAPSLGFATPKAPAFAPGGYAQPLLHYGPQGALKHATPTFSYGNMAAAPTYSNMGALHQVAPHLQFQPLHPSVAAPGYASGAAQPGAGYAPMGFNSGSQQVAMPVSRPDSIYPKMAVDQKAQGHDNIFPTHQTGPKAYLDQLSFGGAQVLDAAFAGSGSGSSKSKKLI